MRSGNSPDSLLHDDSSRFLAYSFICFATVLLLSFSPSVVQPPCLAADEQPSEGIEKPLELIKEEESVSIAMRQQQPISQAPSEVYVITAEDIRKSGAVDIPTLLRRIPGMEVMQVNGADFNVSVRGDNQLQANKLLVMVDGRSIYIDAGGTVFWKLFPVTLPEIKRIEVLKGPASAIYGFNAFDGIINIITKSPEEMKGTTLQFGGGNFGTIAAAAIQAGKVDKFGYRLSIGTNQNSDWTNHNSLAFRDYLFNVQTEYNLTEESKFSLSGGLVDSNRFNYSVSQDTVSSHQPGQGYAHLVYEQRNFYIRGFWNRFADSEILAFNPLLAPFLTISGQNGSPNLSTTAETYNLEAQHTLEITSALRFIYGANYRYNTLSGNLVTSNSSENRLGFYGHANWNTTKALTLVAGLRYDLDTFIHPTVSPRVALIYNLAANHTLRVSGSVAYRPPTLSEKNLELQVVTNPPLPPSTTSVVGGTNLGPEEIISYEAEYQGWYLQHRLRTRAAVFYNHLSDLISTRNESPTVATSGNDPGDADIYGGEVGLEFLATTWLSGFVNYAYQEIHQSFTGRVQRAGPHSKFNAGLRGEWQNGLSADATYQYYGSVTYPIGQSFQTFSSIGLVQPPNPTVGSYNLLNLRGAYRFWQQKAAAGYRREAEVAMSVFNTLNDKAIEHPLGEEIGRRFMGWLTVRF